MELGLMSLIKEGPVNHSCVSFPSGVQSRRVPGSLPWGLRPCCPESLSSSWHALMGPFPSCDHGSLARNGGAECSARRENTGLELESRI